MFLKIWTYEALKNIVVEFSWLHFLSSVPSFGLEKHKNVSMPMLNIKWKPCVWGTLGLINGGKTGKIPNYQRKKSLKGVGLHCKQLLSRLWGKTHREKMDHGIFQAWLRHHVIEGITIHFLVEVELKTYLKKPRGVNASHKCVIPQCTWVPLPFNSQ